VRRGIAPVRKLRAGGVPTAFGTDNLGDAFNVYATPDLLTHFLLTALGCHFRTVDDLGIVLEMATSVPAGLMRLPEHGLAPGRWADLVVIDAESLYEAVTMLPVRSYVFKRGVMTAVGRSWSTLFGPTAEPSVRV
jgi:cytosine deaminase